MALAPGTSLAYLYQPRRGRIEQAAMVHWEVLPTINARNTTNDGFLGFHLNLLGTLGEAKGFSWLKGTAKRFRTLALCNMVVSLNSGSFGT